MPAVRQVWAGLLLLAACTGDVTGGGGDDVDAGDLVDAPELPVGDSLGSFQLTYYWIAYEGDHPGPADTPLVDDACAALATVSADFADAIALEGTGRLLDGRLLNVAGACDCETPCYVEADEDHPWGYGVQNRALEPFRSIAVDRDVIEYGTGLYLPAIDGLEMPGEAPWGAFEHDGCVLAADTGGGIVGAHIDFFVGARGAYLTLDGTLGLDELEVVDGGERCADAFL
jgi:3D (Asp-Asp-Asp) domain-containing protein